MNQISRGLTASLFILTLCSVFFTRCANIVPPAGGARDTLPPRLLSVNPKDSSLRFKSHLVTFHFNEYVELDNVIDKLIVSPTLRRTPVITAKLRTITMQIKDTLQPNTTYTFNFGDAVKDVNERNPIEDFQYVVSTGDYLDSLQITGRIRVAETGMPDSSVAVMLYGNLEDSAVSKEKPLYLAKSKGDGSYRFKNLKPGTYRIFAVKEEDKDFQYTQRGTEMIGFTDSLIHLDDNIEGINLAMFKEVKDSATLAFEAETKAAEAAAAAAAAPKAQQPKKPRLTVGTDLSGGQQDLGDSLTLSFNYPLKSMDSAQIQLLEDTLRRPVRFSIVPADTVALKYKLVYNWKPGMPYELILPKGFATDTSGLQTLKADTVNFAAKGLDDYGIVTITLAISDSARQSLPADSNYQFVVQLIAGKEVKYSGVARNGVWEQELVQPAEYEIRVLVDTNHNGVWDTGSYYDKPRKQPERVFGIKDPINVKKNWKVPTTVKL
ncbi:Ig-like domain-containing domain [Chitinophaga lutea]